jgi:hypothetical protein
MSYIGSTPTTQSFIAGTDYFNGTGSAVNFTMSRAVNTVNDIEVIVNNVEQIPSGYSVSGTTLTFSVAPSAGTSNIYVRYLSTTLQSVTLSRVPVLLNSMPTITSPWAWNSTNFEQQCFTALANALTINADAGAPTDGQRTILRFKDNGTARALTWTTGTAKSFRAIGVTLPTTTVANKTVYIGCLYNAFDSRWDAVAVAQEV